MKEILIVLLTFSICTFAHCKSVKQIKEYAIKEYLQHPEHFKVYQIKDDTVVVDIKVEYLK